MASLSSLKRARILSHGIVTLLALNVISPAALWDGGGADSLWSNASNWDFDAAPLSPDVLTFDGAVRLNPVNDLTGFSALGLFFAPTAGAFSLTGEAITLSGEITNSTALEQTLNFDGITLAGASNLNTGEGIITFAGLLSADAGVSLTKTGAGTLKFSNPGAVEIADGGSGAFTVNQGTVLFDGGDAATYAINGEAWLGATAGQNVNVLVNSGALNVSTWLAVARGNGTGEVSSDLVLNGNSVVTAANFSAGYFANDPFSAPRGSVTLNGTSVLHVTNDANLFILAESAGSEITVRLNDSSLLRHNGIGSTSRVGASGRGLLNIASATAGVEFTRVLLGSGANGSGAIWNRGSLSVTGPASTTNFAVGNAPNSYGYYLHDTEFPLSLQEVGVGGEGGGNGVLEVRSGVVSSANWLTMNRTAGANVTTSMVLLSGGTLQPPDIAGRFYVGQNGSADQYALIDIGAGGRLDGGANSDINLMNTAWAPHVTALTVHNGGTIETARIFAGQTVGTASVNFNGGTLVAEAGNANFLGTNLDGVFIHAGGMTVDTNGFDPTITASLQGPTESGLMAIPITDGGVGYLGRPVVKITGGGGLGATAVANFDEATGQVTGITITSPGSRYSFPPTITLVGGGAKTPATLGAATLGANANTGAFTKIGGGTLTLTQPSTFGGGATINGGTLRLANTAGSGTGSGPIVINTDGTLTGSGGTAGALQVNNGGTLAGSGNHLGIATIATGGIVSPGQGVGTLTVGGLILNTGTVLNFEIADQSLLDRIVVSNSNALTINGGGINLLIPGGVTGFSANGVYNLIGYTGAISGVGVGALDVLNESAGKSYAFGENAGFVTLTVATFGSTPNFWNVDADGSWSADANWSLATAPNTTAALAMFGGGGATITQARTITVDAPQTVGSIGFNSAAAYTITGASQITLNNGAVPNAEITVTNGSHTIAAGLTALSAGTQITVAGSGNTLTISGPLAGATDVMKFGGGTLVLSGTNSYTGNTTITAGTLEINGDASVGSSIAVNSGATLRVRGVNAGISKPLSFELAGTPAASIGPVANAPANFTTEIPTGSNGTISSAIAVASGSHAKTGGGTLTLVNPDVNVLSNVGGTGFMVREGAVVLNGGFASTYNVAAGELGIGDAAGHSATLTLETGALVVDTTTSVGLRNGTTGASSRLILNGGIFNTQQLFSGFSGNIAGFNARPVIEVNNDSLVNISTQLRLGESAGAVATMNISGVATVSIGGRAEIGFGGKGIMNISGTPLISAAVFDIGYGNNVAGNTGVGVVNQTGGAVFEVSTAGGDWRIGGAMNNGGANTNDALVYGSYTISGPESSMNTGGRNFQIGAGGRGVLDIRDGARVDSGAYPVVGRYAGSVGLLNISSGSFNQSGLGNFLIIGEDGSGVVNVSNTGSLVSFANPGAAGSNGGTGGIRLGHGATGSGVLNLNGGTVQATGIAESNTAGRSFVYLNGGTLRAGAENATFMQGLDHVVAGPGHALIDTNGFNITIGQAIASGTGQGVTTIPVVNGGSGYLGQPLVSITGDGTGATAVANLDPNGVLTSVTITNPGINYTSTPTISLLGGGATTEAILGAPTIAAAASTGGLIKQSVGILTLSGANTYTGATVVEAGSLVLTGSINGSSAITVESGAIFDVSAAAGGFRVGATQTLRGAGNVVGPVSVAGTVSPGDNIGALTFSDTLAFSSGATIALEITSATVFDQLIAPAIALDSPVNLSLALSYAPLPNTRWEVLSNTGFNPIAKNLFWSGPEGQLSEGEHFIVNGFELMISYAGGTGNDIILTAVPEPGSILLLLGGAGSLIGLRRFRERRG